MNSEIIRLGLPRGNWQALIQKALPIVSKVNCSYPESHSLFVEMFSNDSKLIAKFSLSFLYGCKGILISHSMLVMEEFRGKGIAKQLQPIKTKIAQDLQVSMLLATVKSSNTAEKNVIKDWKQISSFNNKRTNNEVDIFIKNI